MTRLSGPDTALADVPRTLTASPVELCQAIAHVGERLAAAQRDGDRQALRAARDEAFDLAISLAWRMLTRSEQRLALTLPTRQPASPFTLDEANSLRQAIHRLDPTARALIQAHPNGGFWLAVRRRTP